MCTALELPGPELLQLKRKKSSLNLVDSFRLAGRWDLAEKVEKCRKFFSGFLAPPCGCARARPLHCGVRGCPDCEKKRGSRLFKIVRLLFEGMSSPRFITLTVRNVEEMSPEVWDELRAIWVRLRHQKRFKSYVKGGFYVFEVTNRGKGWHPHIHALVDGSYYPQDELSEDWKLAGGGCVVDIRPADIKGVMELCWYMVKGSQFFDSPKRVMELFEAIKGKRMAGAFGCCFNRYNEIRSEQKEEEKEPDRCPHGNEFEFAGGLKLSDVYWDAETKQWRLYGDSLMFLQLEYFERVKRAA